MPGVAASTDHRAKRKPERGASIIWIVNAPSKAPIIKLHLQGGAIDK